MSKEDQKSYFESMLKLKNKSSKLSLSRLKQEKLDALSTPKQ
jgi:hypothetical protein